MDLRLLCLSMVSLMVISASAATEVQLDVDDVIIYPQAVALVYESGQEGAGNEFLGKINERAYANSIRVSGASEVAIDVPDYSPYYFEGEEPVVQLLKQLMGQSVKIGEIEGVIAWVGKAWLGMSGGMGFVSLPLEEIDSIESAQALEKPEEPDEDLINVTWKSGGGRQARVSYLSSGLSWSPVYFLDAGGSSRFEYWAKVDNDFEDLEEARIRLVGGEIQILSSSPRYDYAYKAAGAVMAEAPAEPEAGYFDQAPVVSAEGEYEVYDLGRKSVKDEESRLISIFAGSVTPEKEYVWDARYSGDSVQRIYVVENPGRTWVSGKVKVFEDGMLVGEDSIPWTPNGEEARITIGRAPDIDVSKRTTSVDTGAGWEAARKHTTTLKLENRKSESVTVSIKDSYPSRMIEGTFSTSHSFIQKPGNLMELNVTLSAGAEEEIVYSYMT